MIFNKRVGSTLAVTIPRTAATKPRLSRLPRSASRSRTVFTQFQAPRVALRGMEDHFYAAVLLGLKGLIEIGAVIRSVLRWVMRKVVSTFFSCMSLVSGSR